MTTTAAEMIREMRELLEGATEGKWENSRGFVRSQNGGNSYELGDHVTVQTSCQWVAECRDGEAFYNPDNNASFIAAAKNNMARLLAIAEGAAELRHLLNDMCIAFANAIPHPAMQETAEFVMRRAKQALQQQAKE